MGSCTIRKSESGRAKIIAGSHFNRVKLKEVFYEYLTIGWMDGWMDNR